MIEAFVNDAIEFAQEEAKNADFSVLAESCEKFSVFADCHGDHVGFVLGEFVEICVQFRVKGHVPKN